MNLSMLKSKRKKMEMYKSPGLTKKISLLIKIMGATGI